jgi:hypothetical protein
MARTRFARPGEARPCAPSSTRFPKGTRSYSLMQLNTSGLNHLNRRVEVFEFNARIDSSELPVGF